MGAWGPGNFENDEALDWVFTLEEVEDLSAVKDALDAVQYSEEDYLDAWECSIALAAVEVLAALLGRPSEDLPEEVGAWVQAHRHLEVNRTLISEAENVISAVLQGSELQDLWEETDEYSDWQAVVGDLRHRLEQA